MVLVQNFFGVTLRTTSIWLGWFDLIGSIIVVASEFYSRKYHKQAHSLDDTKLAWSDSDSQYDLATGKQFSCEHLIYSTTLKNYIKLRFCLQSSA